MKQLRLSLIIIILGWILTVQVCQSFLQSTAGRHVLHSIGRATDRNAEEESQEPNEDFSHVSDAEALLACYAYLNRRKLLENSTWTQQERRQRMKAAARPHFFWEEDLSKIAARLRKQMQGEMTDDDDDDYEDDDDEQHRETPLRPSRSNVAADVWSGDFTSFPIEPSLTHKRRSQAAKRTWTDPDFRERWYSSRWGDRDQKEDADTLEEKELEQKVRALPSGFWGSSELSDMTEQQIEDAIKTYLFSRNHRIESRKNTLNERKAVLRKQMEEVTAGNATFVEQTKMQVSRDALFAPDEAAMKEAQQKRSERAKKLYAKRLENSNSSSTQKNDAKSSEKSSLAAPRKYQPSRATPQDAMLRIQRDLESGILPNGEDVRIIMEPGKLAKRRNVLRQILSEFFDMRGKCVPMRETKARDLEFVTKCDIGDLGALVIDLIIQKKIQQ